MHAPVECVTPVACVAPFARVLAAAARIQCTSRSMQSAWYMQTCICTCSVHSWIAVHGACVVLCVPCRTRPIYVRARTLHIHSCRPRSLSVRYPTHTLHIHYTYTTHAQATVDLSASSGFVGKLLLCYSSILRKGRRGGFSVLESSAVVEREIDTSGDLQPHIALAVLRRSPRVYPKGTAVSCASALEIRGGGFHALATAPQATVGALTCAFLGLGRTPATVVSDEIISCMSPAPTTVRPPTHPLPHPCTHPLTQAPTPSPQAPAQSPSPSPLPSL